MTGKSLANDALIRAVLKSALTRLYRPVTAASLVRELPEMYKIPLTRARGILDNLVAEQEIWQWSPGKTVYYCGFDPAIAAQVQILKMLQGEGKTLSEIGKGIKGLPGYNSNKDILRRHLKPLLAAVRIYRHPPNGNNKADRYSQKPPDPLPHLGDAEQALVMAADTLNLPLETVYKSLGLRLGIPPGDLPKAKRSDPDNERQTLEAIPLLLPKTGDRAAITVRTLRRALFIGKQDFDETLISLACQGKVILHEHDFPSGLSPEDKSALVQGGNGVFYTAVVPRLEE